MRNDFFFLKGTKEMVKQKHGTWWNSSETFLSWFASAKLLVKPFFTERFL